MKKFHHSRRRCSVPTRILPISIIGIGSHGPSENSIINDAFIEDCSYGVATRGRNTMVNNVVFAGTVGQAVSHHEDGAGLSARGCTYDGFSYPNRLASLEDVVPRFRMPHFRSAWLGRRGVVTWSPTWLLPTAKLKFKIDGTHCARIPAETVVRIPRVAKAGQRALVIFHADAGCSGFFIPRPENAALAAVGAALGPTIKGTAGSALKGTTGAAGDITFGRMSNGDLYIEHRGSATYTFRLAV